VHATLAASFGDLGSGAGLTTLAIVVGLPLLLLVAVLFATMLLSRRHHGREIREIVAAMEELRSGRLRQRPEVDPSSPLAMISDAVHRLGQDLGLRLREADGARVRLAAVMDTARDLALIAVDADGDVRSFSPGAVTMFGWDEDAIAGESLSTLFESEAWEAFLPKLSRRSLGEEGVETASVLQRRDGETFPGRLAVRAVPGPGGDAAGFLLVVRDQSDERRLSRELEDSERRYRGLLDELGEGVFIQQGGEVVYANRALAELCRVPEGDLGGSAIRDHVAARDVLLVQDALAELEAGRRERVDIQATLPGSGGARIRAARIAYGDGHAVLGSVEDVSAARRVEAELRRSESRLDAVLETVGDGILVLDGPEASAVVQMINRGFAELFDLEPAAVLGLPAPRLLELLRDRGPAGAEVAARLEAATPAPSVSQVDLPAGGNLQVLAAGLTDHEGRPLGRILLCSDDGGRGRLEQQLELLQGELLETRAELEQAGEHASALRHDYETRLEQKQRIEQELRSLDGMKDNLLGTVAHDLQMPLVAVRGYNEVLRQERLGPLNEQQCQSLDESLRHIDRMRSMIDSLLTHLRMAREGGSLDVEDFALGPVVDDVLATLRQALQSRGLSISVVLDPRDVAVRGDRQRIERVFENLLSNAVKYNRQGGSVEVGARRAGAERVEVQIRDTGIGIREEELETIFQRHVRAADVERGPIEGQGLGLASVRETLWLHGCSIKVQSRVGEGSTFTFNLPVASGEGAAEAGADVEADPEGPADPDPERPRLKIIRRSDGGS
jgi:PAS domain S-box-containing protein